MAKLHAACGASVNMNYRPSSSGASNLSIAPALVNYFSYDKNNEVVFPKFFSEENWHQHIQNELQNGRPVIVGGTSVEGNGHEFLIDGYRYDGSEPFYSVNWGWGGSNNGYFLIDNLQPSSGGTGGAAVNYSYDYEIICGIQPENDIDEGVAFGCSFYTVDNTVYSAGDNLTFSIPKDENLMNCSTVTFSGNINVYASNGTSDYLLGSFSLNNFGSYWQTFDRTYEYTIPSTIPTGTYRIIMKSKEYGSSVEKEVYTAEAPEVQINGSFLPGDVDLSGKVDITDVVALVNYILSNDSSSVLSNGDMDGNGTIDITDVVALVNLILGN